MEGEGEIVHPGETGSQALSGPLQGECVSQRVLLSPSQSHKPLREDSTNSEKKTKTNETNKQKKQKHNKKNDR